MTEVQIMEEIKRLTLAYLQHSNESFFTDKHLKNVIASELFHQANTPQKVVDRLYQKHEFTPYVNLPRHQVLVMNRTPGWLWLIQTFFIAITFPLSVPFLMIWSWMNRGTPNFIRTDGSIYLDKVLSLCRKAGVTGSSKTAGPSSVPPSTNSPSNSPTLNSGVNMQPTKAACNPMQALSINPPQRAADNISLTLRAPMPSTLPTLEEDINGMANMAEAFTQVMMDNPTMFIEAEVRRSNGEAVFTASPRIHRIGISTLLQKFDYASAWTKPWQELDEFSSEVHVFRNFSFVRRPQKTDNPRANIVPPTSRLGRAYAWGLTLYSPDSKTFLESAKQNRASGPTAHRFYLKALAVAKSNEEYVNVMEAMINHHCESIEDLESKVDCYTPENFTDMREKATNRLDEYIDRLPENYYLCSRTARTLEAYFDTVWGHLECHEIAAAWNIFAKDEIFEKSTMKALIETPFVQRCLPHLASMWYQLMGLFHINGGSGEITDSQGRRVQYYMQKALNVLEEQHLPEASIFEQKCVAPLLQMQTHVEVLFQEVPRETALYYAIQQFRDNAIWDLEGRWPAYRHEIRGIPCPPSFFPEQARRIIQKIDAKYGAQHHLTNDVICK